MASWYHCEKTTGAILSAGFAATTGEASLHTAPDDCDLFVIADGLIASPFAEHPDFSVFKAALRQKVNDEFNAFMAPFVSNLIGQDRRYSKKESEALAWTQGADAAHPEQYVYMIAEASVKSARLGRAVSVSDVRAGIMAQIQEGAADPFIEGTRVAARQVILEAPTLPAILAAADVNWAALIVAQHQGVADE